MINKIAGFICLSFCLLVLSCEKEAPPEAVQRVAAGNVIASSGSPTDIQRIHDLSTTHDGDTITLPAGRFLWDVSAGGTSGIKITKAITLQGQTTTNEINGTDGGQTVLLDSDARRGSGGRPFIRVETGATTGRMFRVTGLAFDAGSATTINYNGAISLSGQSRNVRVDHCSFRPNLSVTKTQVLYFQVSGAICGVADHNVMIGSVSFHLDNGDTWPLPNGSLGTNGDGAFAAPTDFGTDKFFFIEDNYVKGLDPSHPGGGPDDLRGGRWVWRYNHMYDAPVQSHGTEDGRWHGGRAREVYKNDFHFTNASVGGWGGIRSGVTVFHDNTSVGRWPGDGQYGISVYRTIHKWPATPFFGATGDNPWDINATESDGTHVDGHAPFTFDSGKATTTTNQSSVVDNTKNWPANKWAGYTAKYTGPNTGDNVAFIKSNTNNTLTITPWGSDAGGPHYWAAGDTYEIHLALVTLDQPGRGQGDLITGSTPINSVTGKASWPNQKLEPAYSWNNVYNGQDGNNRKFGFKPNIGGGGINGQHAVEVEGRDFFNDTPMPGYHEFQYPHPLVSGSVPVPTPTPAGSLTPSPGPSVTATAAATTTPVPSPSPTPAPNATPVSPQSLTATQNALDPQHVADLKWQSTGENTQSFFMKRSPTGQPGTWATIISPIAADVREVSDGTLMPGGQYFYQVVAVNNNTYNSSEVANVTTSSIPVPTPTATAAPTATATATATATQTATATATSTPTATATATAAPTATATVAPTPTVIILLPGQSLLITAPSPSP